MLNQVRDTLKGAVAWVFVVLLVGAFSLWGVPELRQMTRNAAITVGKQSFSAQYVQNEFTRVMNQKRAQSNGDFTQEQAVASGLPDQVVGSIATSSALNQLAGNMRLAMPREIISDFLQQNKNFQNPGTGKFDEAVLRSILRENNISVSEFERRISEDLLRNQLINSLTANAPAPKPLVEAMLLRETERRRIAYLIVTDEMAGKPAEPTPDDLQTYYKENPAAFTSPEYRTFDVLTLRAKDFREGLKAPEEELRRIYDLNKPRLYDIPERRTIYQMRFDAEADAQAAAASLKQGETFEKIAADKGQTLDSVTFADARKSDIVDPAVADAAFADDLKEGAIVGPVKSLFGWTVVQVVKITPPETKTFEDVRGDLEERYLETDTRRELLNAVDKVEEERDTGAGLAAAAEAAGFSAESFGPVDRQSFTPGGAILKGVSGEALAEAFRLEEGDESEAVELPDHDGYFFVSVREITPPALKPFEDVRDKVEQSWRKRERDTRISNTVRDIRAAVEGGQGFNEAAAPFDRTPTELVIDRKFQNEAISPSFNEQIFFADKGDLVSGPAALGDAQIIAQINDVGFARNRVSPDEANTYGQYLGYQLDQELLEAFLTDLRNDYGVKINHAQLDSIYGEAQ